MSVHLDNQVAPIRSDNSNLLLTKDKKYVLRGELNAWKMFRCAIFFLYAWPNPRTFNDILATRPPTSTDPTSQPKPIRYDRPATPDQATAMTRNMQQLKRLG